MPYVDEPATALGAHRVGNVDGIGVGHHDVVPHAESGEDVRGHVQGMTGIGREFVERAGGLETQRSMNRVVDPVDQVVSSARMIPVGIKHRLRQGGRFHVGGNVPHAGMGAHDGQCMEQPHFDIVRIALRHLAQKALVRAVALRLGRAAFGGSIKNLEALEMISFLHRPEFRGTRRRRGRKPVQNGPCLVRRLLVPYRVIVHHGLTPISHAEFRIDFLRTLKLRLGVGVLEKVQQQHPLFEGGLRFR